jgi:hypothetical protein
MVPLRFDDAGRQARRNSLEELLRVHVTASPDG